MKILSHVLAAYLAIFPVAVYASCYVAPDNEVDNASIQYRIKSNYGCNAYGSLDPAFYPNNIEISVDQSLFNSRPVFEEDQDGDLVIRTNICGGHEASGSLLPIGQDDAGNTIARRKLGDHLSEKKYLLERHFFGYDVSELNEDNKPGAIADFSLTRRTYSCPVMESSVFVEGDGRRDFAHIVCHLSEGVISPDEFAKCILQTRIYKPLVDGEKIHLRLAKDIYGNPTIVQVGSFHGPKKLTDQRLLFAASRLALNVRSMLKAAVVSQE